MYLELGRRRTGAGRLLYNELFTRLAERGFRSRRGYDAASVGLHRAMGFEVVGTYRRIGWKFDSWHDVAFAQRAIGTAVDPPAEVA